MRVERTFVDTNILLYAHDRAAGEKRLRAASALRELWDAKAGVLSTQIFQEFAVNAARKPNPPLPRETVERVLGAYRAWRVHRVDVDDVFRALALREKNQLSFWDALVVTAAVRTSATRLYTEDLNDGEVVQGVRIVNPLVREVG
jgi:predicted nucleic acid-binding protein